MTSQIEENLHECTTETSSSIQEPERRYVNGRWLCLNNDGKFLEYIDDEWRMIDGVDDAELQSQWAASASVTDSEVASTSTLVSGDPTRCVVNGVNMTWNPAAQQWIPDIEVNEDFLATYHANYGVAYDYSQISAPTPSVPPTKSEEKKEKLTKEERLNKRREMESLEKGWVDIGEDKNTNVYVSGLPSTITEDEFMELMSKCGVIMKDPRNNKPKIKLYKTATGEPKGDGTCCYVKMESVDLALQIIDGWDLNGCKVSCERAKFELKGDFDPAKKKRKLTPAQKKRFLESQQRMFEWKPEKPRNYRPVSDCTVVFKNMFTLEEIDVDTSKILDLKSEMQSRCERFGLVKKVVVYDSNPDGVITVTFDSVDGSDAAVRMLDRTIFAGRVISVALWDGREKFKREETDEERRRRDEAWQRFIDNEQDDDDEERSGEGEADVGEKRGDERPAVGEDGNNNGFNGGGDCANDGASTALSAT